MYQLQTQVARRNLTPYRLRYFRGLHFHADRRIIRNSEGINQHNEVNCQNGIKPQSHSTARVLADKYNVSPRTIARDSRLADALIAIGEVSPEAKQSILSGNTRLTRKELDAVLSGSEGFVAEITESIDNGTFKERRSENKTGDDRPLYSAFTRISNLIQRELRGLTKTHTPSEVKEALRTHIAVLEDIYEQL